MRSAQLTGRLGRDPELVSPAGMESSILKFSIANDDARKKQLDGRYEKVTYWFDIVFFTKKPQYWLNMLYKGTPVLCDCDAEQETWQNKEGQTRSRIVFKIKYGCFPVLLSDGKKKESQQEPAFTPAPEDDIPF